MKSKERDNKGILAVIGSSIAIFWPGALIFGFPGVMAPYWMKTFHVGRGAIGNILFFVLAAVGIFMFFVGRWQEKFGIRRMITIGAIICGLSVLIIAYASNLIYALPLGLPNRHLLCLRLYPCSNNGPAVVSNETGSCFRNRQSAVWFVSGDHVSHFPLHVRINGLCPDEPHSWQSLHC